MKFAKLVKKSNSSASLLGFHFQNFIPYKKQPWSIYKIQNFHFRSIIGVQISRIFDPLFTEPDFFTEKCKKIHFAKTILCKKL